MGTDYHPASPESRPFSRETRPFTRENPPQGHYSTATGEWDGQLPHIEVAAAAADQFEAETPNWPGILTRMKWTRAVIRTFKLPPPQAALLNEIAYRDGKGIGCTATMETLALDTGYNEKSIRRAIQALEQTGVIIAHGNPGQKKIMGLPVRNGQLLWPTPDRESGVCVPRRLKPRTESPGFVQSGETKPRSESPGLEPTPDRESGVEEPHQSLTSDRETGVLTNPGQRDRATPVRESDITRNKQGREREEYINFSLISSSNSGSPVRESEVANPRQEHEQKRIRALVVQNWPLLEKNGWNFLEPAIRHYQTYGITYLQRDLRVKRENLEKEEEATRTCFHCNTVHESTDQLRECAMCHDPKCISEMNPCYRIGCDGKPRSRSRAGPQSRQRK